MRPLFQRKGDGDRWTVPETKELIGGYWLIQTKSMEEAIEWAKRAPFHAAEA
jgi:hypothetical protein